MPAVNGRRTQEERRTATRTAILDATIGCVIDYGYADTTTTRVADRAGVSRGAQVHHFPTKAELVAQAVAHLARRRAVELGRGLKKLPPGRGRVEAALDLLWQSHSGPLFEAMLELWVAARTDEELRAALIPLEEEVALGVEALRERLDATGDWELAIDAMQGLALRCILRGADARELWLARRERFAELLTTEAGGHAWPP
jgi:AcrR family transcriptional regulator